MIYSSLNEESEEVIPATEVEEKECQEEECPVEECPSTLDVK
jgi:hypothetical protein